MVLKYFESILKKIYQVECFDSLSNTFILLSLDKYKFFKLKKFQISAVDAPEVDHRVSHRNDANVIASHAIVALFEEPPEKQKQNIFT